MRRLDMLAHVPDASHFIHVKLQEALESHAEVVFDLFIDGSFF